MGDNKKKKVEKNYYEILNVPKNATRKEILEAYLKAKKTYDKNSMAMYSLYTDDESEGMMNLIEEAYQVLINPQRRDIYNRESKISDTRTVVNIILDKPGEMKRAFVETPDFKTADEDKRKNTSKEDRKLNKGAFKAYASIAGKKPSLQAPKYVSDRNMEEEIKKEREFSGAFFGRVRRYKNMSFSFVSNKLKLAVYHIEAIENEDFNALPVRVYTRGFISSYAGLLGIDQNSAVRAYMDRYDSFFAGK